MVSYLLDTNVFNQLVDDKIPANALQGLPLYFTHNQKDELQKTKDEDRKRLLMEMFHEVDPKKTPTTSYVLGVSRLGGAELGADAKRFEKMQARDRLQTLP